MGPTVFRAIPPEVLNRYEHWHRVAIWKLVPKAPMALVEPLLRHELEHAAQWQRYGRSFIDLDGFLREAWNVAGDSKRYFQLPSERACNDAAARHAERVLPYEARERLRRFRRYRQFVMPDAEPPSDVLDATVEALRAAGDAFLPQFDESDRAERLQGMEESARNWPQDILEGMRDEDVDDIVVVRPYRVTVDRAQRPVDRQLERKGAP
jgi:hypothetical protein